MDCGYVQLMFLGLQGMPLKIKYHYNFKKLHITCKYISYAYYCMKLENYLGKFTRSGRGAAPKHKD